MLPTQVCTNYAFAFCCYLKQIAKETPSLAYAFTLLCLYVPTSSFSFRDVTPRLAPNGYDRYEPRYEPIHDRYDYEPFYDDYEPVYEQPVITSVRPRPDLATVTWSDGRQERPMDYGRVAPITSGYAAPVTSGYTAPVTSGYRAPVTSGYAAPVASGYAAPVTSGYAAPVTSGYTAPVTSGYYKAPVTSGYAASVTPGYAASVTPGYAAPTGYGSPMHA